MYLLLKLIYIFNSNVSFFFRISINHLFINNIFWFGWSISQRMRVYNYGCCDIYNTVGYVLYTCTDKSIHHKLCHNYPTLTYSSLNLISSAFRFYVILCSIYISIYNMSYGAIPPDKWAWYRIILGKYPGLIFSHKKSRLEFPLR